MSYVLRWQDGHGGDGRIEPFDGDDVLVVVTVADAESSHAADIYLNATQALALQHWLGARLAEVQP